MTKAPDISDVTLLDWLARRTAGETSVQIGTDYGVTSERVRTATNRVVKADAAESGEDVTGGYWEGAA